jgi:hypothetical protein
MKTYCLSHILTREQLDRLVSIHRIETAAGRYPHKALYAYLVTQPDIAEKCAQHELLTDFFAYQLAAILCLAN